MSSRTNRFQHSSLQDADSIVSLLEALTEGINKGKVQLSDDEARLQLRPRGLLELNIEAEEESGMSTLNLRLRWNDDRRKIDNKSLRIR